MASRWAQMTTSKILSSLDQIMASSLVSSMPSNFALTNARSSGYDAGIKLLRQQIQAWHQQWHQARP
eukprot:5007009-Ditylum_brightwellii.AAC.1